MWILHRLPKPRRRVRLPYPAPSSQNAETGPAGEIRRGFLFDHLLARLVIFGNFLESLIIFAKKKPHENRARQKERYIEMKTNLYHDTRRTKKDPKLEAPVRISINHGSSSAYIDTGVSVLPSQWEKKDGRWEVVKHRLATRYNLIIAERKLEVERALEELRGAGKLRGRSLSEIRKMVVDAIENGGANAPILFMEKFDEWTAGKTNPATRATYEGTAKRIRKFASGADKLHFEDITRQWLTAFDAWLARTSPSANARNIHLRNIRAVYNEWADQVDAPYPFKRFKIVPEPTRDRSLTVEKLRALFSAECTDSQARYRDYFKLLFLLAGLNVGDLARLTSLTNGRAEGTRHKTGQPFSLCVLPEAQEIIERNRGDGYVVDILNRYSDYRSFAHALNDNIKRIGQTYNPHTKKWEGTPIAPDASVYWARFSWATIAAELDIPERTIGAALAHSTMGSVTSIYIRTDMKKKIDDAQRRVADFVFLNE